MRAVRFHQTGGPDVLGVDFVDPPALDAGHLLVDIDWAGVNYVDIYQREGIYPLPLPAVAGQEGSGRVTTIGDRVTGFRPGDRVAWAGSPGAYAEQVAIPASAAVLLPDDIDEKLGAAVLLQGLTAHYLHTSVYSVGPGDVALVHAAAGGVGSLLVQMVRRAGGTVIGTTSTAEKADRIMALGASGVIRYDRESVPKMVAEMTSGRGVQVVYDGVGKATWEGSLAAAAPRATLALFGAASGQVPPFDLQRLSALGSLRVTRPTMSDFIATAEELQERANDLFAWIRSGDLSVSIAAEYGLADAGRAQSDLASRELAGKLLLRVR